MNIDSVRNKGYSPDSDIDICEALDCNAKATMEAHVKAGHYGIIALRLCDNCKNKFKIEAELAAEPTAAHAELQATGLVKLTDVHTQPCK